MNAGVGCRDPRLTELFFARIDTSHLVLTRACLFYLAKSLDAAVSDALRNAFAGYSVAHWTQHYQLAQQNLDAECVGLQRLLLEPGPAFNRWSDMGVGVGMSAGHDALGMACQYG